MGQCRDGREGRFKEVGEYGDKYKWGKPTALQINKGAAAKQKTFLGNKAN